MGGEAGAKCGKVTNSHAEEKGESSERKSSGRKSSERESSEKESSERKSSERESSERESSERNHGSIHQGHEGFSGQSRGKQCSFMICFSALLTAQTIPVIEWNSTTIDNVLVQGDNMYLNAFNMISFLVRDFCLAEQLTNRCLLSTGL